ncbi:MAG: peptidase family protein [Candidatus Saccharibacteria bacterium]|nr:peptidase family protein [Candidatus Saccharibacteria bacterium]
MAVYDDQSPEAQEDNALREQPGDSYNGSRKSMDRDRKADEDGDEDEETTKRRGLRERDQERDQADTDDVKDQVRAGFLKAREEDAGNGGSKNSEDGDKDSEGEGFYKEAKSKIKASAGTKGKSSGRNKLLIGAGIGLTTLSIGFIASFGNFLAVFKLDHILQNIDVKTFSRFNASFSGRSDAYFKAYLKMRLTEIQNPDGSFSDTMLFKGDRVDTDSPIRDWYRTLRTGSFERDLQKNTGIAFSAGSIRAADGTTTLRPVKLTFNGEEISKLDPESSGLTTDTIAKLKSGKLDNAALQDLNKLGEKADSIVTKDIFENSKSARKAVKEVVKDETHFYNVLKRRHIRKDIENKTGITKWKLFETTRSKITAKKVELQKKILNKILPDNKAGQYIGCFLGSGPCNFNGDQNSPANQRGVAASGEPDPANKAQDDPAGIKDDGEPQPAVDANGNPILDAKGNPVPASAVDDTAELAGDVAKVADGVATSQITDEAATEASNEGVTLVEKVVTDEVEEDAAAGSNPVSTFSKVWRWLKRIAKISNTIKNGTLAKIVRNARLAQLAAIYATYSMARDQGKSGQLSADEFGNLMGTLNDVGQSEGWMNLSNPTAGNSVSAAALTAETNVNKVAYCKMTLKQQKANKIHYFCGNPNESRAADFTKTYQDSAICALICPIATVVNTIKDNPVSNFIVSIGDFAASIAGDVFNALHITDAFKAILNATGIGKNIGKVVVYVMTKAMAFLGAGPMYDGSPDSGAANFLVAGSAAQAEASTRGSGGVISTPATLAYTNNLAAAYTKEHATNESLFDKYASLSNTSSLFSTMLFSVTNFNISNGLNDFLGSLSIIPKTLASVANGNTYAATSDFNPAAWAGIDTYDIPPACQTLDPLDSNYLVDAVGVVAGSPQTSKAQSVIDAIRPNLTYANERDSTQFWKLVYDEIGKDDSQEEIAGAIYNCAIFDQRVMSGLGYTSGYTNDGGLNDGASVNTPATPPATTPTGPTDTGPTATGLNGFLVPSGGLATPVTVLTQGSPHADWSKAPELGKDAQGKSVTDSGTIGTNSAGQPIKVYIRAAKDTANIKTIIIGGGIHGTENGGGLIAWDLLYNEPTLPSNVRVIAIPEINGYGIDNAARKNKNNVDLNRNEDYNWGGGTPESCSESNISCMFYKGSSVGSEPETKALDSFLLSIGKVSLFAIYHDNLNYVAPVGGTSVDIGNAYAASVGMHGQDMTAKGQTKTVSQHGSLDAWFNKQTGSPSILIELSDDQSAGVIKQHANAIMQLLTSGKI